MCGSRAGICSEVEDTEMCLKVYFTFPGLNKGHFLVCHM